MRQHDRAWIVGLALPGLIWISTPSASTATQLNTNTTTTTAARAANSQAAADEQALKEFLDEVARYLELHRKLHEEVPGLTPGLTASQVAEGSDTLAVAIQRARPRARQGDFFRAASSDVLKRRIAQTVREANLAPVLEDIDDEPPTIDTPRVYLRFPASAQMATMPVALLRVLPPLPDQLEYRIVGGYLVLRDTHAAIILDFITGAVPRTPVK
jgi:hypothetical protein